ncbi:hypothetical protein TRICHSKD4_4942 [Roseibium sp. TrichSKD4]|uniref:hypothetical protein n=1 Tax=Roseibium sp. TrichSKD4 TaxID=744980 RepID=UPI0001E57327|nr:hypothetical protein [Roseibium sp. TrichSKD4]EFO29127.1 hypothetical protein TRICHSKD4_4942 [Roseibium sp. TrichSKD4]
MTGSEKDTNGFPQERGKRRVAAVTGAAKARLEISSQRFSPTQWPIKGMPYQGVDPGKWREEGDVDDTGCLPEDCPVYPLGFDGENYYYIDTKGQVFCTGDKAMGVERLQKLFSRHEDFLCWAWPAFSKKKEVVGFKAEEVRRDLFAAAHEKGGWQPNELVRGRGAWRTDDDRLVLHCGEYLWMDGRLRDTGEVGAYFYMRRPGGMVPWDQPVPHEDNPAMEIFRMLRTWNMERGNVDAMLTLGWLGVAMLGGALEWRPSIFVVGEAGSGKSELIRLLKIILGRGLVSTTNATEAGLYQYLGYDSLSIWIDEIEDEDDPAQSAKVYKMARDAASGSVRIRGGADHKGVEFMARSAFGFSGINPPPIPVANLTRLAIIQLGQLISKDGIVPKLSEPETTGPRLLRRLADQWTDFPKIYEQYRTVLRVAGHDSRGQNTFGTFLACAHLLLGDDGLEDLELPFERLDFWGSALAADIVPELQDKEATWLECLNVIRTTPIDNYSHGQRQTVAQIIEELKLAQIEEGPARSRLANADIGLLGKGMVGEGYGLAIPNKSPVLARMLSKSKFGGESGSGSWAWALRRGPPNIIKKGLATGKHRADGTDVLDNRVSVAGRQVRCIFISLHDLMKSGA